MPPSLTTDSKSGITTADKLPAADNSSSSSNSADGPTPPLKPGTSAFAAAGATPLDADVPAAAAAGHTDQSLQKSGPSSPHRPPLHPASHANSALPGPSHTPGHTPGPASQGSGPGPAYQGLSPAGSLGHGPGPAGSLGHGPGPGPANSPGSALPARTGSGNLMRLGLTRSLNSKKSSPNRVCCNALLAAFARATPPRWRQVGGCCFCVCGGGAHGPCVHRVRHDFGCLQTGLRSWCSVGLTRSLNSKKSSPNRVCCNALLAAYAICPGRATPPRWRQVGDLCCFCVCVWGGGLSGTWPVCALC